MLQEIAYWLIASIVVVGFGRIGLFLAGIGQRRTNRRIQQGIREYLLQKAAART
jgi:hypothetical protein